MRFPWRLVIIMPAGFKNATRNSLETMIRKADIFPPELTGLSSNPAGAITSYGTQIVLSEKMKSDFDGLSLNNSVSWFLLDNNTGGLVRASSNVVAAPLGSPWGFREAAQFLGLSIKR
jgi:hypothetical protein